MAPRAFLLVFWGTSTLRLDSDLGALEVGSCHGVKLLLSWDRLEQWSCSCLRVLADSGGSETMEIEAQRAKTGDYSCIDSTADAHRRSMSPAMFVPALMSHQLR